MKVSYSKPSHIVKITLKIYKKCLVLNMKFPVFIKVNDFLCKLFSLITMLFENKLQIVQLLLYLLSTIMVLILNE